jgi:tetratricopeptide (TPR) repeat protein
MGAITFSYKDYEASYRAFDQVVKLEPKNTEAGLSRAVAARGMGNYEEAERGYKAVISLDERYAAAHFNLGVLYQEFTQKPDEAIKAFESVLRVEQNDAALRKDATERIKQVQIQLQTQREAEAMMKQQAEEDRKRAAEAPPPAPESAPAEPAPPAEAPTP